MATPTPSNPTLDEMKALVEKRLPSISDEKKSALAEVALTILEDPTRTDDPLQAVKLAIARSQRAR